MRGCQRCDKRHRAGKEGRCGACVKHDVERDRLFERQARREAKYDRRARLRVAALMTLLVVTAAGSMVLANY